jgi:cbb3-type cytochrome c oxidase subunit III
MADRSVPAPGDPRGTGDGRGSIALKHSLPSLDISSPVVQAQTDGELFWKISNGKGAMPNWGSLLPEEDRWRLVMFVRTLRRAPAQ